MTALAANPVPSHLAAFLHEATLTALQTLRTLASDLTDAKQARLAAAEILRFATRSCAPAARRGKTEPAEADWPRHDTSDFGCNDGRPGPHLEHGQVRGDDHPQRPPHPPAPRDPASRLVEDRRPSPAAALTSRAGAAQTMAQASCL